MNRNVLRKWFLSLLGDGLSEEQIAERTRQPIELVSEILKEIVTREVNDEGE